MSTERLTLVDAWTRAKISSDRSGVWHIVKWTRRGWTVVPQPESPLSVPAIAILRQIDAVAPCQPGDGSSPLESDEDVEIVIKGATLLALRAVLSGVAVQS
jgi:hypothetical protein